MTIEARKLILERNKKVNPALLSSIKKGIQEQRQGKGIAHEEVRKLYEQWLQK